jgi:putrescine aminotransferase
MGRTGKLWGVEHWNVVPDIMSSAKALGGGVMPIGAFMSTTDHWQHLIDPNPFLQTTTFGGNPLSCAAAIATIKTLIENDLPGQAADKGAYFKAQIAGLAARYPDIYERVTGKGLLIGMHFHNADVGYAVAAQLFKRGVLVAGTLTSAKSIRVEPPLIISREQIDTVLNRLEDALAEVNNTLPTPAYA